MGKWLVLGAEWVYQVVKANLVWLVLVLAGGGIFGLFPATIALACLVRQWFNGETKGSVWQTMKTEYRNHFKLGSQLLLGYGSSLLVIGVNLRLAFQIPHLYFMPITYFLLFLLLVWLVSLLYLFPLIANYEGNWLLYSRQAIALGFKDLKITAVQIMGIFLIWLLTLGFSSLVIFGTAVIWQVYAASCCRKIFAKIIAESRLQGSEKIRG